MEALKDEDSLAVRMDGMDDNFLASDWEEKDRGSYGKRLCT